MFNRLIEDVMHYVKKHEIQDGVSQNLISNIKAEKLWYFQKHRQKG